MCCHDEKNMDVNAAQGNGEERLILLAVFCPSLPLTKETEHKLYVSLPLFVYPLHHLYSEKKPGMLSNESFLPGMPRCKADTQSMSLIQSRLKTLGRILSTSVSSGAGPTH